MSVRSPFSGQYFGSFMLADRHRRQDFWTHMFKQNLKRRKNCQKKTEFKQERNDRPKSVFENFLKNFPQAMYARKYRIVFYWIHMFGVKPCKISPFQPGNTSNTSDWRVRTNLNGTAQKPWGPPLPRGCNLVLAIPKCFAYLNSIGIAYVKDIIISEIQGVRKIIKPSYLRTQKELWELPLHGCIRNGLLMCLKVFLECLNAIWILFFEKNIKFSGLIAFDQRFDKSYAPHFWPEDQTFDELISKMKTPNSFGISLKQCSMW